MSEADTAENDNVRGYWEADALRKACLSHATVYALLSRLPIYGEEYLSGVAERLAEDDRDPNRSSSWTRPSQPASARKPHS